MPQIHEKIRLVIQDRGLSIRGAASACRLKYRTLHSCINDERDVSHSTLQAISEGLQIDFRYFSDRIPTLSLEGFRSRDRQKDAALQDINKTFESSLRSQAYEGKQLSLQGFLNWWVSNNGRLENYDQISHRVDLFDPPASESRLIKPIKIGYHSLATKCFELKETDHLRKTLEGFTVRCNDQLVAAHLEAIKRGEPVITHPVLDEKLRSGRRFARQYRRVLAPVYLANGEAKVVNYSEDI